jgi:integrase
LLFQKNYSQKVGSKDAEKSRFYKIKAWFSGKEWNTNNFLGLIGDCTEKKLKEGTLNKLISLGKCLDEYLKTQVVNGFKYRTEKISTPDWIPSPEEIIQLAKVEYPYTRNKYYLNQRQEALIMLMGTIGCRIEEVLSLVWTDLKELPEQHIVFKNTKNGTNRSVCINHDVYKLLTQLPHINEYIFISPRSNKKLTAGVVNDDLKKRAKYLGLSEKIHNHLFRHSWATYMLERGVSETDVCQIGGWKDPKMLLRYKNSNLSHIAGVMRLHPLIQSNMSWKERGELGLKELEKYFSPRENQFFLEAQEGAVAIRIEPLAT